MSRRTADTNRKRECGRPAARGRSSSSRAPYRPRQLRLGRRQLPQPCRRRWRCDRCEFDDPNDLQAQEILEAAYPGREVVMVPAKDVFAGGGIHCLTQQEPATSRGAQ